MPEIRFPSDAFQLLFFQTLKWKVALFVIFVVFPVAETPFPVVFVTLDELDASPFESAPVLKLAASADGTRRLVNKMTTGKSPKNLFIFNPSLHVFCRAEYIILLCFPYFSCK